MKNKGIIILIIAVGLISLAALGLSVYNLISINKNNNNDNLIVGKWKNPKKVKVYLEEMDEIKDFEVIYEFKEDGTCKINEYDCTYKNGIIAVNDDVFGEYYINIHNNNKLYINLGLSEIIENVKDRKSVV